MKQRILREARRIVAQGRKALLRLRLGNRWDDAGGAFGRRRYPSYDDYLAHQRTKLDAFRDRSIERHDRKFFEALTARLAESGTDFNRRSVLCLAARQGSEVRAFIARGAFAVGIDLNPGRENRYVLVGDFHDLQFGTGTVDVVYSNSFDHAFDIDRLLAEVHRVLAADGLLIAEVGSGEAAGAGRGFYEAFSWQNLGELVQRIEAAGFRLEARTPFEVPWRGEQLLLRREMEGMSGGLGG
jgi:SAM-dependent methyltransferase